MSREQEVTFLRYTGAILELQLVLGKILLRQCLLVVGTEEDLVDGVDFTIERWIHTKTGAGVNGKCQNKLETGKWRVEVDPY